MNIKRSFSLIEVIITIVIISMISTIVSISINKSLKYYRFKTNIKKIESYFEFAKKISYMQQTDVFFYLENKDKDILLTIGTSKDGGFFKNQKSIKDRIKNAHFLLKNQKSNSVEITFSSSGAIFPKEEIKICDKNSQERTIKY